MKTLYNQHKPITLLFLTIICGSLNSGLAAAPYCPEICLAYERDVSTICTPCDPPKQCSSIIGGASFIYWRTSQDGLNTCGNTRTSDFIGRCGEVISATNSRNNDPNFKWAPGFRIALGYQASEAAWDMILCLTDLHQHTRQTHRKVSHFKWKLDYDTLDLVFGSKLSMPLCCTLSPYVGLRGAQINQSIKSHDESGCFDPISSSAVHNRQDFKGLGPLFGLGANWGLRGGLSLYASAAFSVLYGRHHVKLNDFSKFSGGTNSNCARRNLNATQSIFDFTMGFRFEKSCFDYSKAVVTIGYEHHRYMNFNRTGKYGDLTLDGVTVSLGAVF